VRRDRGPIPESRAVDRLDHGDDALAGVGLGQQRLLEVDTTPTVRVETAGGGDPAWWPEFERAFAAHVAA
jgi:hypothetical protein